MFQDLFAGQGSTLVMAIGVVALALVALFLVFWFLRGRSASTFIRGGRNRQPRLAVLDAAAVDARRRLVLIRRDDVEHLIMIGGPTDLVIESRIVPVETGQPEARKPVAIPATVPMRPPQPAQARPEQSPEPAPKAAPAREPATEPAPAIDRRPEPAQQPERPVMLATRVEPSEPAASAPPVAAPVATRPESAPPVVTGPAVSTPAGTADSTSASSPQPAPVPGVVAPPRKAAQSAHSFATTTPFASRATPAWVAPPPGKSAEKRESAGSSTPKIQQDDVRESAMDALDAARSRVLPVAAAAAPVSAATPPPSTKPAAEPAHPSDTYKEPAIDYNVMEADGDDFASILEAELSSDLSDLDLGPPRPLPQQQTRPDQPGDKTKSRDELQEEMERLLGDLSIRP